MGDYTINVFLNDEKLKKVQDAGLADKIVEIDGKKAIQVEMSQKDQKKLVKGFPGLAFDAANACVLPKWPCIRKRNGALSIKKLISGKGYLFCGR